jgi:hypothetical protein
MRRNVPSAIFPIWRLDPDEQSIPFLVSSGPGGTASGKRPVEQLEI